MSPRTNNDQALLNHSALIIPNQSMMSAGFALKQEKSRLTHNYTQGLWETSKYNPLVMNPKAWEKTIKTKQVDKVSTQGK